MSENGQKRQKQSFWQNPEIPHCFTVSFGDFVSFDNSENGSKKVVEKVVVLNNSVLWLGDCNRKKPGEPVLPTERVVSMVARTGAVGWGTRGSGGTGHGRSLVLHRGTGPGHLPHCISHCFRPFSTVLGHFRLILAIFD